MGVWQLMQEKLAVSYAQILFNFISAILKFLCEN